MRIITKKLRQVFIHQKVKKKVYQTQIEKYIDAMKKHIHYQNQKTETVGTCSCYNLAFQN